MTKLNYTQTVTALVALTAGFLIVGMATLAFGDPGEVVFMETGAPCDLTRIFVVGPEDENGDRAFVGKRDYEPCTGTLRTEPLLDPSWQERPGRYSIYGVSCKGEFCSTENSNVLEFTVAEPVTLRVASVYPGSIEPAFLGTFDRVCAVFQGTPEVKGAYFRLTEASGRVLKEAHLDIDEAESCEDGFGIPADWIPGPGTFELFVSPKSCARGQDCRSGQPFTTKLEFKAPGPPAVLRVEITLSDGTVIVVPEEPAP